MGIWLSIDGTGDVQEYSRHNSKWNVVEEAANRWLEFERDYTDIVRVNFAPTISLYNIFNIIELMKWFLDLRSDVLNDEQKFSNCNWNITTWPNYIDIKHLPEKEKVIQDLKLYKETITNKSLVNYKELIARIIERLYIEGNKRELINFVQYNKDLDTLRNQDFTDVFPELFQQIEKMWNNIPGKL